MNPNLHSRKYLKQVVLNTITLLLFICMVFIVILYRNAYQNSAKSIAETELQRTNNLSTQVDTYLEQLHAVCTAFAQLNTPSEEFSLTNNYWARMTFNSMLDSHIATNSYIENIDVVINNISMSPSKVKQEKQLAEFSFFTLHTEETLAWPYCFDFSSTYGKQFNAVTITVSGYQMSRQLFSGNTSERLEYLITKDGTILLTNQKTSFFCNIDELYPDILSARHSISAERLQSYGNYYYVFSETNKYGFQVLSFIDKQVYSHQITAILLQTLLMASCLLLLTLLLSLFLISKFYRPINTMVTLLQTYITDDLHDYESEIEFIHDNLVKYVAKGNNVDHLMPQTMTQLQNAQTAVLQHQINSHFLFNTLENLKAISVTELGIDNEVENSIVLMNHIIKEGITQKTSIVPLSHELHLVDCYLKLMQLRFPDVDSNLSVDETLLQHSVFKFSLQPVLENCFTHAFKTDAKMAKRIAIDIFRKENDLVIQIKDNGIGLNPNTEMELRQLLASESETESLNHVGLCNVHKRITTVFGPNYGITLESTAPGTTVTITYPITFQQ